MNKLKSIAAIVLCMITFAACGSESSDKNTVNSVEDMKGKIIGVQLNTTGDIFASDIEDADIERYNNGADAIMALKASKIDCVLIDEETAKCFVKANDDLKILDEQFVQESYAICIKKGNTELKDKVNASLAKFKEDGTLNSIINNYINDKETGISPYVSPEGIDRSNGTLTIATNANFPPYEYIKGNEIVGIDIDIAQAIADNLGMNLEINNMEFGSIITAVDAGKADLGIAGMTVTADRLKSVDFSDSYATSTQVIIVRKN